MKDYPAIKFTILFTFGILSVQFFQLNLVFVIIFFLLTLILILFQNRLRDNNFYTLVVFLSTGALVFALGNIIEKENEISFNPFLDEIDKVKNTTVFGEIEKINLVKNQELSFYLSVDSMYSDEFKVKDKILLLCKVRTDNKELFSLYNQLKPGFYLKLTGYYYKGREERNPGEFDYNAYLKSKGILGILSVTDSSSIAILNSQTNFFENVIYQARKKIDWQLKKYHSPETASLLRGLLLADRGEINYQTKQQFINSGVVHVLAVSGLHVGYIILIFLFLFGRFNLFLRSILTAAGLLCFMFITGVPPSVFRATVMAIVIIIAFLTNRSTNVINSISIAALIILVLNPNEIYNPGFQLSFSAVLSIALIFPNLERIILSWNVRNRFLKYLLLFLGISLSAQIGTLPFTLLYFNQFSLIALLTNLIVIPAIGVIIATAVVTLIFSTFLSFIAVYFAAANDLITNSILHIIKYSGELSFSHIQIYNYSIIDLLLFYLMIFIFLYNLPRFTGIISKTALFGFVVLNIFFLSTLDDFDLLPENNLSVFMIDVGQGDSFLIKFSNGKIALIDAGNTTLNYDNGERVLIPLLDFLGIDKIDFGFVSHIDSDHYAGFVALVLGGRIKEIFKPAIDTTLSKDLRFEKFLREMNIPVHYFSENKMMIGNTSLYFLFDEKVNALAGESTNNRSEIIKLVYGKTSFLFTGDAEKNIEKIYVNKYKNFLDSDVLKAGHHGSKTSSSDLFLNYVTPEYSLISAGFKNKFGHPADEVIQRLKSHNSKIYRTDLQKAILLRSDANQIKIINW